MAVKLISASSIDAELRSLRLALTAELSGLLPGANVEEIGSTAIPGALTKGDLDLLVTVEKSRFFAARNTLEQTFEVNDMDAPAYFASFKGARDGIDFGVQLAVESECDFGFVKFRDALRAAPGLVVQYNAVKLEARSLSMAQYRAKKHEFIESVLASLAN